MWGGGALPFMEWCLLALSDELFVTVHASPTLEGAHCAGCHCRGAPRQEREEDTDSYKEVAGSQLQR